MGSSEIPNGSLADSWELQKGILCNGRDAPLFGTLLGQLVEQDHIEKRLVRLDAAVVVDISVTLAYAMGVGNPRRRCLLMTWRLTPQMGHR